MVLPMQLGSESNSTDVAQKFFAGLAAEIRRPGVGENFKVYTQQLLLRAQEIQLYDPAKEAK
jgi:hypothetical protein